MIVDALPPAHIAPAPVRQSIDALRWDRRVLIVFAGAASDRRLSEQRDALRAERSEIGDRDLTVVEVVADSVSGIRDYAPRLRAQFGVGRADFAAILIGKDGAAKLRSPRPVSTATLFATIDAMPMRRREITER
ncbi:DUF4174 domain-containing protein [Sphingomonas japonica]|uniref:DUF4174 domain-containing protein n=1 Tax=Sphingomonas japonica TaxID=511662 RepID=A0ABX0U853_9SPHN|nr:DUF4174 domain-containing protein [Sphingomonas japonica]NIJ24948.1 hypothetical protein [Sphingomonas japonica]